jgi:peptidyl-tRNA hydrolase
MATMLLDCWRNKKVPDLSPQQIAWLEGRFTKVVLQAENEEQLHTIHTLAKELGLDSRLITDSGATEFHGVPTDTVVCIGPDYESLIDSITGPQGAVPLKLY